MLGFLIVTPDIYASVKEYIIVIDLTLITSLTCKGDLVILDDQK